MTEALQQEIRTLKNVFESERDPEGRVFAPLADAYRRAGEVQQAVRVLNEGLARHPDFVPGHVVAAQLYVEQGLSEEGAIAARQALELDAENVVALRSLLQVLETSGDDEAEEVRGRLAELDPGLADTEPAAVAPVEEVVAPSLREEPAADLGAELVDSEAETLELRSVGGEEPPPALQATAAVDALPADLDAGSPTVETPEAPTDEASATDPGSGLGSPEPLIDLDTLGAVIPEAEVEGAFGLSRLGPRVRR